MRISDWSSDVCSSDLAGGQHLPLRLVRGDTVCLEGHRDMWHPDVFQHLHPPLDEGHQYRRADHVDIESGAGGDHQLVACAYGKRPPAVVRDVEPGLATEQFQAAGVLAVAQARKSAVEGQSGYEREGHGGGRTLKK